MPSHPQWPEMLEEQGYLVQMLSETAHDPGALEHTCSLLDVLRADLRTCTTEVADLERENREGTPKHRDSRSASSALKCYKRVTASISLEKHGHGEDERQGRLQVAWTTKQTLRTEVKNLESKAQILRRQKRHHDEFQRRLVALYASITEERKPPSGEEDEAEEDVRRAQHTLYEIQKKLDRHKTLATLLRHGDDALISAGRHLTVGGPGGSARVDAAKLCAVQTSVVVDQARRLDSSFFDKEDVEVLKPNWLHEVFQATSSDTTRDPSLLLQALKPHHATLLSLISRAHKRTSVYDATLRRAALQCSEARARRDALKRQVLVTRASAEAEGSGELFFVDQGLEKDGSAKMKDITAGLEGVIPVPASQRSSAAAVSSPRTSEERQRAGQDEPVSRISPIIPHLHAPQSSRKPQSSKLTPDLSTPPTSSPLSTPPSDHPTHSRNGSGDTKSHQSSVDLTQRQVSSKSSIRQPKPIHHNRHPVLDHQYDRQWQSGSGLQHDGALNVPSQGKVPSGTSECDEATFQPRAQPRPRLPLLPGVQPSPQSSIPIQPIQQNAKPLQPPGSSVPNPIADTHPHPSSSVQNMKSEAAEPLQMLPPIPQSQPNRPPLKLNSSPLYQSDSREAKLKMMSPQSNAQLGRPELQTASGSPLSSLNTIQGTTVATSLSMPTSPSQRPHGILKQAPVMPRPAAVDADPWGLGVKVAAAPSSRPQPKLKTVLNLWRGAEGFKNAGANSSRSPVTPQPEEEPPTLPRKANPRAAMQTLRFSEAVEIIARPAVDSDPYDDEEENKLPPSPKRGSVSWFRGEEEGIGESSEDSSGGVSEMEWRPDTAEVPVKTVLITDPSQQSISSASSSYEHSQYSTLSSSATSPPSGHSILGSSRSSGAGLKPARTTSPQDFQYTQPVIGPTKNKDNVPLEGLHLMYADPMASSYIHDSRRMTAESMKSDHELLQAIFPSPPRSTISHHDLMFTS